jgi:hypothetical protein
MVWLLSLALVLPTLILGMTAVRAQTQPPLRVILADFTVKTTGLSDSVAATATASVYNELQNSGQGRFDVIPSKEVLTEAKTLGIRVPSQPGKPAYFSDDDLTRIAKSLGGVDAIIRGHVESAPPTKNHPTAVAISVTVQDVASGELINGAVVRTTAVPRPGQPADPEELLNKAVEDGALSIVQQLVQRQLVTATVLNINQNLVILNRGLRDGVQVGDELVVLREGANNTKTKVGKIKIARAYATDSEADVLQNIGGIRPEDLARVLYRQEVVITPNATLQTAQHVTKPNFSAIGATLAAIGIGVLVAYANRGGQQSVTNLSAEATRNGVSPTVRITWGDNIFGQGGIVEYHIWRQPDFPFNVNLAGIGTTNGGTNTGTNGTGVTNLVGRVPIGVTTASQRKFFDMPKPFSFYQTGGSILIGVGNGSISSGVGFNSGNNGGNNGGTNTGGTNTGNNGGNNGGTNGVGCGAVLVGAIVTGFQPGTTYQYQVSAIIQRQVVNTVTTGTGGGGGGITNGGGGGTNTGTGGGGGQGGTNGGASGFICIETDPAISGFVTPLAPVLLGTPADQARSVDITQFNPTWNSRAGADLFQVEVSTDRTFTNPNLIYSIGPIFSTAPNSDGVLQGLSSPVNLTTASQLLSNSTFSNFVQNPQTATPPTLFWHVGARHDLDQPGPISEVNTSTSADNKFRFVYSDVRSFTPAPPPPPPPGSKAALALNMARKSRAAGAPLPLPGDTSVGRATSRSNIPSIQDLLTGRGRTRH